MTQFSRIALAGVSLLAMAVPAYAQDAPVAEDEGGALSSTEIIVTARRRDESIQDVPLSIQAVTGQTLEKLEIRRFEDISKVVPGLSLSRSVGVTTSASMRGVNFDGRASGASTSVEMYRNDAVITGGALFQAIYDIGQIEVLRGPQGTLRGRASPSGSITVTTRRPDLAEPGGYVSGTVSDAHRWNFNGAINVPLIGDKLGIRVAGFVGGDRGNGIFGMNIADGTIDSNIYDKTEALRASVRADPFDGVLVLDFNYEAIHNKTRQYGQVQSLSEFNGGAASPRTILVSYRLGAGSEAGTSTNHVYQLYNWQAKLRQWGQALTYVGSHTVAKLPGFASGDGAGLYDSLFVASTPPPGSPINRLGQFTNSSNKSTSHEVRLQNEDRIAGLFDYVVGYFTVSANTPTILTNSSPTGSTLVAGPPRYYTLNGLTYRNTLRFRSDTERSVFGNVTVHLGDNTEVSGGIRKIWLKVDSGVRASISLLDPYNTGALIQRACYGNSSVVGCLPGKEATIYAASIKHKFTEDLMAYASFGTSWRPGNSLVGWGLSNPGTPLTYGPFISNFLVLPDETSKSFEVGLKTSFFDRRVRFNISAFYQKFDNFPLYGSTTVQSLNQPTQAGAVLLRPFGFAAPVAATVKGLEADFSFDISPRFNLAANLAFADSKVSGAIVPCVDTDNDNVQDAAPLNPNGSAADVARYNLWLSQIGANQVDTCTINASPTSSPRFSGSVQAEYRHPVSTWGEAYLRGFMAWKGDTAGDGVNPNDSVSAYALLDLFAGLRDPGGAWEVGAFVKNLFDTKRVLSRSATQSTSPLNAVGGSAGNNYLSISTIEPREVGVSLRYAFGSR